MLGKRIINTGTVACTTDTNQILDGGTTQSTALYRFEDNANDTSNSTGKFGKGAVFNGSNSYITVPTLSGFTNYNFTMSFWFNSTSTAAQYFMDFRNPIYMEFGYDVGSGAYNNTYSFIIYTGTQYAIHSSANLRDGNWHHIAVTYDGATLKMYIDNATPITSTPNDNTQYGHSSGNKIGASATGTAVMNGSIDQVRIFNKALSSSEVTTLYNETTSTVNTLQVLGDYSCIAAYTFEGNANDLSTNYNGTASNVRYDYSGTASNITYATGKFGKAAVFNGSNSLVTVSSSLPWANSFSISMWLKPSSGLSASNYYIPFYQKGYDSSIGGTGLAFYTYGYVLQPWVGSIGGSYYNIFNTGTLTANQWNHVVLTRNYGVAWELFLNGSSLGTYTAQGLTNDFSDTEYYFGGFFGGSYSYNGEIDQVRIFDKALSLGEINSVYNETTTTAALGTISNPSTVAYYKMADGSDETGSYNATTINNVNFNVQGKYGFAGKFNGTNSYITTGLTWPGGTQLSWSGWIKTSNTKNTYIFGDFASGGANASHRFSIRLYSQNFQATINNAGGGLGTSVTFGTFAHYGNWAHLVVTIDGTTLKGYVNGSQLGSAQTSSESLVAGANPFVFGNYGPDTGAAQQFDGTIDQVRIFNKTISAAEVTTLYNEIQCANTITTPESYFNTKLYTGTDASHAITGVGFAPDFTWIKARTDARSHTLIDSVRGATKIIQSESTNAEWDGSSYITSLDSNGFTVKSNAAFINSSSQNYVSWNWKGASSSVTNNVGTITSTVSASPESGFSVVKYTATGTIITNTVGHGLTTKPGLIIQKSINSVSNWFPITDVIDGSVDYLMLNSTAAKGDMTGIYANFSINDTTFTNWYSNTSGDVITYCFANVDGYQRIGSFIGNGSNNGPFIYTGFEPAWVIIKNTDTAYRWYMLDNKRCTTNPNNARLFANDTTAEATNSNIINFHTNGFEIITSDAEVNKSGDKILFMAIAANPDTTAPTKANSFKTKIYTGTGSTRTITGLGFKPDFIWTRNRDTTDSSALVDSVRGIVSPTPYLASDASDAQATSSALPTSVQADGYTISGAGSRTNTSGEDYVSWNWKAADHDRNLATINNDGNIASAVSANRAAGFSIITYNPNDTVGMTVGHGLSQAPQIVFSKRLDSTQDWGVYTNVSTGNTTTNWLSLNDADPYGSGSFMTLNPTTLELPQTGAFWSSASSKQIAYCYHSVTGHSSIGQYTGSGASGKTVTVGFEPSWVLIKNATTTGLSWSIWDNQRSPSNPRNLAAWADYAGGDHTQTNGLNFNSTSFELLNAANWLNKSGDTFIYMAFK